MRIKFIFVVVMVLLCHPVLQSKEQTPPWLKPTYDVSMDVAKSLHCKYRLSQIGYGTRSTSDHQLAKVNLIFYVPYQVNLFEARRLIVDCVEETLETFNNSSSLQPYLVGRPLSNRNLYFSIFVYLKGEKYRPEHCDVGFVELSGGEVIFSLRKSGADKIEFEPEVRESYEEALKIVRGGD